MAVQESAKRDQIEKSLSTTVTAAAVAVFVTIFCLVSAHSLYNKLMFQNRVISAKTTARNQLRADVSAANQLSKAYENFNQTKTNLLGATVTGKDNDNAKIVLDALPSVYDYPALTSTLQNLLSNQGVTIDSIGGTDQSATVGNGTSGGPPVVMPFSFSIDGPYQNVQNVVSTFEKSITPFQFATMNISGDQTDVTLTVTAQTFFQPVTQFKIATEAVK